MEHLNRYYLDGTKALEEDANAEEDDTFLEERDDVVLTIVVVETWFEADVGVDVATSGDAVFRFQFLCAGELQIHPFSNQLELQISFQAKCAYHGPCLEFWIMNLQTDLVMDPVLLLGEEQLEGVDVSVPEVLGYRLVDLVLDELSLVLES